MTGEGRGDGTRVSITCTCGRQLRVRKELVGKRVRCPACGNTTRATSAAAQEADDPSRGLLEEAIARDRAARHPRQCPSCGKPLPSGSESCPTCQGISGEEGGFAPVPMTPREARRTRKHRRTRAGIRWPRLRVPSAAKKLIVLAVVVGCAVGGYFLYKRTGIPISKKEVLGEWFEVVDRDASDPPMKMTFREDGTWSIEKPFSLEQSRKLASPFMRGRPVSIRVDGFYEVSTFRVNTWLGKDKSSRPIEYRKGIDGALVLIPRGDKKARRYKRARDGS